MPSKLPADQPPQNEAESREEHERALDKTLADTFPASDPLSTIPNPSVPDPASEDSQAA